MTLVLSDDAISEKGGVSTVTATLDHASSEATTVTVAVTPVDPATADDYTLSENLELTIPAGETDSTGTVTITAVDNAVDAPDKTVTVSATTSNSQGVTPPSDKALVLEDDEGSPTVTLVLSDDAISEKGGVSTVTATLDRVSSEDTTILVSVTPVDPAVAADYTLSSNLTLTIPAGETDSTGTVTITAVDNAVDAPDKTVTVSATTSNSQGVTPPSDKALTLEDDEDSPTVMLVLSDDAISEKGGVSTVTATLDRVSSEETTITVSVTPVDPAVSGDYILSGNLELTIPAGETDSEGLVTITAVDNAVDAPDKEVTVSGTATNTQGVTPLSDKALTLEDDEDSPTVTLVLDDDAIPESGGVSTVTATLDRVSSEDTTITVSVTPVDPAVAGDYTLSENLELTIPAGETDSEGLVTITAVDNAVDAPDKTVTVSATDQTNSQGVTPPSDKALVLEDDEGSPTVTLVLSDDAISEKGGVSTVTATLDHASSEATTVTVAVTPVDPATADDYTLSENLELTIPAGATDSTGTVTITAVDNAVDAPDKTVTVSGTATNSQGVTPPSDKALVLEDDEGSPTVTLVLDNDAISEKGGVSTVTATLDRVSSEDTTILVSVTPVDPAVAADYTLSSNLTLTIPAGATDSTGTVTITAVDNAVDAPDKTVTVSATATNDQGVTPPSDKALTLEDDEDSPTVTLVLSDDAITENGGVSTVTATLDRVSSEDTTILVSVTPVDPAVAADYTLSGNLELTIPAGETDSEGLVTITAVDNAVDAPDKDGDGFGHGDQYTRGHAPVRQGPDPRRRRGFPDGDAWCWTTTPSRRSGGVSTVTATLDRVVQRRDHHHRLGDPRGPGGFGERLHPEREP